MAKKDMLCPFSGRPCKNCAFYIGRHYYLCYNPRYRGYIRAGRRARAELAHRALGARSVKDFSIPRIKYRESLDPFTQTL